MDEDYVPTPKRKSSCSLSSPPSVSLQIPCTPKSHSFCFVCKKPGPKLIVVSSQARFSIFLQNEIIIPAGSRCCPGHMYQDNFTSEAVSQVKSAYDPQVLVDRTLCYSPCFFFFFKMLPPPPLFFFFFFFNIDFFSYKQHFATVYVSLYDIYTLDTIKQ